MAFEFRFGEQDYRLLERERVFDGYFAVDRLTLQHKAFDGGWSEPLTREMFERGDAVGVLPYDPVKDQLILIEQFRPGAIRPGHGPWMLELVAGIVEPGESDEEVVHREAMEEAGCSFSAVEPIAAYYPSSGACSEHVRLFVGCVAEAAVGQVRGESVEGEDILVHALAREQVFAELAAGRIDNGHTLVALLWFQVHWQRIREAWRSGHGD
jgi:ADP-ribose pyrophosphatase